MPTSSTSPAPACALPLDPACERRLLWLLAAIQFAHIVDFMIMMPLGPILMREFSIDARQFGLLVSAYGFTAAAAGLPVALVADRVERKRLLLSMFGLFALATLACGLAPGFASLFAARAAAGAFGGALGSMVHTMVGDLIPFARRGQASGIVMSGFSLSTVAGVPLSLLLANAFGWRMPFFFIAALALFFLWLGARWLPALRGHLPDAVANEAERAHPFAALAAVMADANARRAFALMALLMLGGFTVVPYLTIYATANVGIAQEDIPYLYLAGGFATLFTARAIGRLADRFGKLVVFRWVAAGALLPLFALTHLPPVPLAVMIACATAFFILVPGRMVPAMALMTAAVCPRQRGAFLAVNGTVMNLSSGLAAWLAGLMMTTRDGRLEGYGDAGLAAMAATLAAAWLAGRIRLVDAAPCHAAGRHEAVPPAPTFKGRDT